MLKRSSLSKQIRRVRLDTTYFAENWKYCNKIIFKCVNSNVGPIFILFFFWIKWLWVLWTVRKPFFFISSNKPTASSALPSLQRPSTNVVYVTLVRVLFFFLHLILFQYHLFIPLTSYWVFPNIFCSIIPLITNISYFII